MTYTEATSWHTPPRGTVAQWIAALSRHGADDPQTIASAYFVCALAVGLNPDLALAQGCHETGWFQSQRWLTQFNAAGIGITDSSVAGPTFVSIGEGIEAHLAHLCCYVYTAQTCPIEKNGWHDPRHNFHDGIDSFSTLERPERRWAYPGDGYLSAILAIANSVVPEEQPVSVPKPAMTILDSPNRDGYSGTRRVDAIVLHITQGTDSRGWLTSPQSKASANYLIERDGTIYQLVPPDHDAWANGQVDDPDTSNALIVRWLAERDSQGHPINFNQRTISIEHEGMSSNNNGGSLTDAQVRATVALQAWLCATFTIPPDQDHILGHYQIDDVDRHYCPGFSAAEWREWTDAVAALVHGGPVPAPAPMLAPVVTEREDWGGKGRLISLEVTVVNDDTGKYYSRKKRYTATGIVYDDWREV